MKNFNTFDRLSTRKGSVALPILTIIAILTIGGGTYLYVQKAKNVQTLVSAVTGSNMVTESTHPYFIYSTNNINFEERKSQVFVYNFDTKEIRQLSVSSTTNAFNPVYSKNKNLVAYFSTTDLIPMCKEGPCGIPAPRYQLLVQNIENGKTVFIENNPNINNYFVAFSPDGTKLAYITPDNKISVVDLADKTKKVFPIIPVFYYTNIQWDNGGSSLYYLEKSTGEGNRGKIMKLDISNETASVVYENKEAFGIGKIKLTPDGMQLSFILNNSLVPQNLYSNYGNEYIVLLNLQSKKIDKYQLENNDHRDPNYLATNGVNTVGNYVWGSDNDTLYFQATEQELYFKANVKNHGVWPGLKSFNIKTNEVKTIANETGQLIGFGKDESELLVSNPIFGNKETEGIFAIKIQDGTLRKLIPIDLGSNQNPSLVDWKTYTDDQYRFEFKYPQTFYPSQQGVANGHITTLYNGSKALTDPNQLNSIAVFANSAKGATSFPNYQAKYPVTNADTGKPIPPLKTRMLGPNTFYYYRSERFEGILMYDYYILHGDTVYRFVSVSRGIAWSDSNFDEENDPTHATLKQILPTFKFTK